MWWRISSFMVGRWDTLIILVVIGVFALWSLNAVDNWKDDTKAELMAQIKVAGTLETEETEETADELAKQRDVVVEGLRTENELLLQALKQETIHKERALDNLGKANNGAKQNETKEPSDCGILYEYLDGLRKAEKN